MSTPEQDREVMLTGHLILEAFTELLGPVASDVIIVRAPARDESGNFLKPGSPRFPCAVTINGQTFNFEAWTSLVPANDTLQVVWQVPGAEDVIPSVIGWVDNEFEFQTSFRSRNFVRDLEEATDSARQSRTLD